MIEAFKSTLAELAFAHLLLIIIDISDPNWKTHIGTVLDTLDELGIKKDHLFVFNKADCLSKGELDEHLAQFRLFGPYVVASTKTEDGLDHLKNYLEKWKVKSHG